MSEYKLKRLWYDGAWRAIALQSANGPCPLLAIANCLVLRGELTLADAAAAAAAARAAGCCGFPRRVPLPRIRDGH